MENRLKSKITGGLAAILIGGALIGTPKFAYSSDYIAPSKIIEQKGYHVKPSLVKRLTEDVRLIKRYYEEKYGKELGDDDAWNTALSHADSNKDKVITGKEECDLAESIFKMVLDSLIKSNSPLFEYKFEN